MGVPLYITFFSPPLVAFRILFIFNFCHFNYTQCGSLWVHLVWAALCFLYLVICFLPQVWEVFSYNFIKYIFDSSISLSFPSGASIMQMLVCLILFQFSSVQFSRSVVSDSLQASLNLFSFFKICFLSAIRLGSFHYSVFQTTCVFFCFTWSAVNSFQCVFSFQLLYS